MRQNAFAGPEQWARQDVYATLNDALETQQCSVVGTAERVERSKAGALVDGWFAVTPSYIWIAGRDEHSRQTVLWRFPHGDVTLQNSKHGLVRFVVTQAQDRTVVQAKLAADVLHGGSLIPRNSRMQFECAFPRAHA